MRYAAYSKIEIVRMHCVNDNLTIHRQIQAKHLDSIRFIRIRGKGRREKAIEGM